MLVLVSACLAPSLCSWSSLPVIVLITLPAWAPCCSLIAQAGIATSTALLTPSTLSYCSPCLITRTLSCLSSPPLSSATPQTRTVSLYVPPWTVSERISATCACPGTTAPCTVSTPAPPFAPPPPSCCSPSPSCPSACLTHESSPDATCYRTSSATPTHHSAKSWTSCTSLPSPSCSLPSTRFSGTSPATLSASISCSMTLLAPGNRSSIKSPEIRTCISTCFLVLIAFTCFTGISATPQNSPPHSPTAILFISCTHPGTSSVS